MFGFLRRLSRPTVAYVHDLIMAALSFVLSLYLRVGHGFTVYEADFLIIGTASFAAIAGMVYLWMDLYRGIWRYASLNDLLAIARAVTLIILIFLPVMFLTTRLHDMPRSMVVINWFVLMTLLAAPRILYRMLKDGRFELTYARNIDRRIKVLLIGAGDAAEMFIQAMTRRTHSDYHPIAILDEADRRVGRHIRGVPVVGNINDLAAVVERLRERGTQPQRLVITKPDMETKKLRRLVDGRQRAGYGRPPGRRQDGYDGQHPVGVVRRLHAGAGGGELHRRPGQSVQRGGRRAVPDPGERGGADPEGLPQGPAHPPVHPTLRPDSRLTHPVPPHHPVPPGGAPG